MGYNYTTLEIRKILGTIDMYGEAANTSLFYMHCTFTY